MSDETEVQSAFDSILSRIIDEWFENVSSYYITRDQLDELGLDEKSVELKKFHDDLGHRIKFAKDELDFTYGLRAVLDESDFIIEISVNNKVPAFKYGDFQDRLNDYYQENQGRKIVSPYELRNSAYGEVFLLHPDLKNAFSVEKRSQKADIMRLAFRISERYVQRLAQRPVAGKQLVEEYCVSPFRSVYATVYRRSL